MSFMWQPVLYRAGAGWHGNAFKKTAFRRAGPNFERPLLRALCFFCGVKQKPKVYRAGDQQPQYQAERARCAGYGLVTKISSKITIGIKKKKKTLRSGGISDEGALNRRFSFTPGVNNPNESCSSDV